MKNYRKITGKALRGFSLAEVLIAIVIITILTIGSIAVYSSQLAKARDTERMNDVSRIKLYLDTIVGQYGSPPNSALKARGIKDKTGCKGEKVLYECFKSLKTSSDEDLHNMFVDPSQGVLNTRSSKTDVMGEYNYRYGADQNAYKICAMLEDQSSRQLNADVEGKDTTVRTDKDDLYCLSETPPGATPIEAVFPITDVPE